MGVALKAGCAYIPIDPHYLPESRIATILESSRTATVITRAGLWSGLSRLAEGLSCLKERRGFGGGVEVIHSRRFWRSSSVAGLRAQAVRRVRANTEAGEPSPPSTDRGNEALSPRWTRQGPGPIPERD